MGTIHFIAMFFIWHESMALYLLWPLNQPIKIGCYNFGRAYGSEMIGRILKLTATVSPPIEITSDIFECTLNIRNRYLPFLIQ